MQTMNKKGDMWWLIVFAIVAIVAAGLVISWYYFTGGRAQKLVDTQIGTLGDYDDDHVTNGFDKCPCTAVGSEQQAGLRGCPKGTTSEQAKDNKKKFDENKCSEVATSSLQAAVTPELKVYDQGVEHTTNFETRSESVGYSFTCAICNVSVLHPGGVIVSSYVNKAARDFQEFPLVELNVPGKHEFYLEVNGRQLKAITVTKK